MSGSHKTSAIARPRGAAAPRRRPWRERRDRTLLDDFTRPVEIEHRLVTGRSNRWILGLFGVAVVGALLAALFVLPVQAWMRQQDSIAVKRQELEVLNDASDQLAADVQHLQTVEGAREAARDELGVIDRGEERISILPSATGALPLPTGWPYDTITQIVAVRLTPPTTLPPVTTPAVTAPAVTVAPTSVDVAPIDQAPVPAEPPASEPPVDTTIPTATIVP
jgi:cell division protein FtsB